MVLSLIFQERLTIGRKPETVTDMVPEGEIILTINVYYPAVFDKVRVTFFVFVSFVIKLFFFVFFLKATVLCVVVEYYI